MKLLHIFTDGPDDLSGRIVETQSTQHEVDTIDLSAEDISYDEVVDAIFACDKLVCW
jgi:hypothetical protein